MYANLTIQLSRELAAPFFRVWGAIYALATLILWTWVFVQTCVLVYTGAMFRAPCLDDVDIHAAAVKRDGAQAKYSAGRPITDVEAVHGPDNPAAVANGRRDSNYSMSSGRRTVGSGGNMGRGREGET